MAARRIGRRKFMRGVGLTGLAAAAAGTSGCDAVSRVTGRPRLPRRKLAGLDAHLSVVGFGGIVVMDETQEDADAYVAEAIARGINYFDVAPTYGNAEERLGPALEPYRDQVFLACKTAQPYRDVAWSELQRSLERMRTDHFDLYQCHAVSTLADVERITGPGGALEAMRDARDAGLIHHIGFSAHSEIAALEMMDRFSFDAILYPLQWACWYRGRFGPRVLAEANDRGLGVLALKALARGQLQAGAPRAFPKCWYEPVSTPEEAALGLRWTLALEGVTAAVAPSHAELTWWACDAAQRLTNPTDAELAQLEKEAQLVRPLFTAA